MQSHDHQSPVPERWQTGEVYRRYVGRWSDLIAERFLEWIAVPPGASWLDVGCGTGTLSAFVLKDWEPGQVTGLDRSAGFIQYANAYLSDPRALFQVGDARTLEFPDASFDAIVSGLVLNFVPAAEQPQAASEMVRVCRPGGTVATYVWDYAEGMQMMRYFWDAAQDLDPAAAASDESPRFPICQPGPLGELFQNAGLVDVQTTGITADTVFADFDDYWSPFLTGEAPAPAYCMSLSEDERATLRETLRSRLPIDPDGRIRLTTRAWAVKGRCP